MKIRRGRMVLDAEVESPFVGIGRSEWPTPWAEAPPPCPKMTEREFAALARALLGPERAAQALSCHGDERPR